MYPVYAARDAVGKTMESEFHTRTQTHTYVLVYFVCVSGSTHAEQQQQQQHQEMMVGYWKQICTPNTRKFSTKSISDRINHHFCHWVKILPKRRSYARS